VRARDVARDFARVARLVRARRTVRARAYAANARNDRPRGQRGVAIRRRARPATRRKTRGAKTSASDGIGARASGA
jgi:hypothetical protein